MSKKAVSTHLINIEMTLTLAVKLCSLVVIFRQTLPIIEGGSTDVILVACVISSDLWKKCFPFALTTNMRARKMNKNLQHF